MGSHSVTCHPTEVILTPIPLAITPDILVLIYRPRKDERLRWPRWLVIPRWFTRRSPIQVLTGPDVEKLRWSRRRDQRATTKPGYHHLNPLSTPVSDLPHTFHYILGNTFTAWLRMSQKSKPQIFVCIFVKYWPIFKIFSLALSTENL